MASYILPQVLVFQEFRRAATAVVQPLLACVIGEQYDLHRYSDPDEKDNIRVATSYNPLQETCYPWPGRQAGAVVDAGYTKVYFEDALLRYYHYAAGSSDETTWVTPGKNRIRSESTIFATGNGSLRSAELLRDVRPGDVVKLTASPCGEVVEFTSSVIGLAADMTPSDIGDAEAVAGNQENTLLVGTSEKISDDDGAVIIANVDASAYDGSVDGDIEEVYTIEVIVGGGKNEAVLRVTSQSGNDSPGLVPFSVDFEEAFEVGTRGLEVSFETANDEEFVAGQIWEVTVSQAYTAPAVSESGTYTGKADTTYVVEVTRGGLLSALVKPQITVSTTTGIDVSGPTNVTASGAAVLVGTRGIYITFVGDTLVKGDKFSIVATAAAPSDIRTLILANNIPDALRGLCSTVESESSLSDIPPPDLDVQLFIKKNTEITQVQSIGVYNWTQSDTELCLKENITAYDSSWVQDGEQVALPVYDASVFVEHRDRVSTNCSTVGTISDVTDIPTVFSTAPVITPDNPLVFGVYKALLNANGQEVKFVGVCNANGPVVLNNWIESLELLIGRDDNYSLVPLTQDKDVLDAVLGQCLSQSNPENGRWRGCFLNRPAIEALNVYSSDAQGNPLLATISDDSDTSGIQYTIVEISGGQLLTNGVRVGDIVRANYVTDGFGNLTYSSYVVDEIFNEESLRLMTGPSSPVVVPSKIEIHRNLSKTEIADILATYPGLFNSRRAKLVWPDRVSNAGQEFPGYFLCAALAGLRSGVLPHQGLTNIEIIGFDDLSRTTDYFSTNQLNTMAASGYWIVTQDPKNGTVYTRHQLTCGDQTDVNQREDSVTTNLDHLSYIFLNRIKVYIGKGNVSDTMIDILRGEVTSILEEYKNTITLDRLGPQIIDGKILELRQHPVYKDRIVCRILLTLPAPFNTMELHLIAQ